MAPRACCPSGTLYRPPLEVEQPHEDSPAGVHPVSPRAVRSPYWRCVSTASVSGGGSAVTCMAAASAADSIRGEVVSTSAGATGSGSRVSGSNVDVGGGGASAFFEKSHKLCVASGRCARSGTAVSKDMVASKIKILSH